MKIKYKYLSIGLFLGACISTTMNISIETFIGSNGVGTATGVNVSNILLGAAIGACIGWAIGTVLDRKRRADVSGNV